MQKFRVHRSTRGFSLLEVVIVIGLLGVAGTFLTTILKNGSMGQKTLLAQDDARILTENVASLLTDPIACANTFGGLNPTDANGATVSSIKDKNGSSQFSVGQKYGKGIQLDGIVIGGQGTDARTNVQRWVPGTPATTGTAFVSVDWEQIAGGTNPVNGPKHLMRYFMVYVSQLDPSNQIVKCVAQAGGSSGFWSKNAQEGIYNTNNNGSGFVGVGRNDPAVMLDVNGGLRPGGESTVTACDPDHEGTQRYNYANHSMEFCNGSSWKKLGGISSCIVIEAYGTVTCPADTVLTGGGCEGGGYLVNCKPLGPGIDGHYPTASDTVTTLGKGWYSGYPTGPGGAWAICCK
jgi:prepilin-type N-terminal cleavage/methylation domain-containing protein